MKRAVKLSMKKNAIERPTVAFFVGFVQLEAGMEIVWV
jgi:hypothetical protein